jgi:hypothetical protein
MPSTTDPDARLGNKAAGPYNHRRLRCLDATALRHAARHIERQETAARLDSDRLRVSLRRGTQQLRLRTKL